MTKKRNRISKKERKGLGILALTSGLFVGLAYLVLSIIEINNPDALSNPFGIGLSEGIITALTTVLIAIFVTTFINAKDW